MTGVPPEHTSPGDSTAGISGGGCGVSFPQGWSTALRQSPFLLPELGPDLERTRHVKNEIGGRDGQADLIAPWVIFLQSSVHCSFQVALSLRLPRLGISPRFRA